MEDSYERALIFYGTDSERENRLRGRYLSELSGDVVPPNAEDFKATDVVYRVPAGDGKTGISGEGIFNQSIGENLLKRESE